MVRRVAVVAVLLLAGCGDPVASRRDRPAVDRAPTVGTPPLVCADVFVSGVEVDRLEFGEPCTAPDGTLTYPGATYVECPGMVRALSNQYGWGLLGGQWRTGGEVCGHS